MTGWRSSERLSSQRQTPVRQCKCGGLGKAEFARTENALIGWLDQITCDTAGCDGVVIHRYGRVIAATSRQSADKAGWTRSTIGSGNIAKPAVAITQAAQRGTIRALGAASC
jgi:hypothetical protein